MDAFRRLPRMKATLLLCVVLTMGLLVLVAPAGAQATKAVLVLHTYGPDSPGRYPFDASFARVMREATGLSVDLYVETLDPNRFRGPEQSRQLRAYLRQRYADQQIAVAVAVYDRALAFLVDPQDPLFPGVPIAALLSAQPQSRSERVSAIWHGSTFGDSVALAFTLQPNVRQIALIDGVPPGQGSGLVYDEALSQITRAAPNTPVVSLRDLPLDDLLTRVRALPPGTIVVVARQLIGRGGKLIATPQAISELAAASPGPLYVTASHLVGSGALGGVVVDLDAAATSLASLSLRLAVDRSLVLPPVRSDAVPMLDSRQLKRFDISEGLLPPASVLLFRQPGIWERYGAYIVGASLIFGFQSLLIAGLVVQARRQRRMAQTLLHSERRAQATAEENQDLAGRLIDAQEAERTRIARALHDGVSQDVAGVGILLSGLKRLLKHAAPRKEIDDALSALQDRAGTMASAVRHLSHELHPGVLTHAGLVAALTQHCAEVEGHRGLTVTFRASEDLDGLDLDLALCLYRVAQEALTNVVRHAGAFRAVVEIRRTDTDVELSITDDGVGFASGERYGGGLGLRSMEERVRLARGRVNVMSTPGRGTQVLVQVPVPRPSSVSV